MCLVNLEMERMRVWFEPVVRLHNGSSMEKYSRFRIEIIMELLENIQSHDIILHNKRFIFPNELSFITFYGPSKASSIFMAVT